MSLLFAFYLTLGAYAIDAVPSYSLTPKGAIRIRQQSFLLIFNTPAVVV